MQYTEAVDLRSFIQLSSIELTWTHCEMLNYIQQVLKYFRKHGCPYAKLAQHLKEAEDSDKDRLLEKLFTDPSKVDPTVFNGVFLSAFRGFVDKTKFRVMGQNVVEALAEVQRQDPIGLGFEGCNFMPDRISTLLITQTSFKKLIKKLTEPAFLEVDPIIQEPARIARIEDLYQVNRNTALKAYRPDVKLQAFFSTTWRLELARQIREEARARTNPTRRITEDLKKTTTREKDLGNRIKEETKKTDRRVPTEEAPQRRVVEREEPRDESARRPKDQRQRIVTERTDPAPTPGTSRSRTPRDLKTPEEQKTPRRSPETRSDDRDRNKSCEILERSPDYSPGPPHKRSREHGSGTRRGPSQGRGRYERTNRTPTTDHDDGRSLRNKVRDLTSQLEENTCCMKNIEKIVMKMAELMVADQQEKQRSVSEPTTPTEKSRSAPPTETEEDTLSIGNGASAKERRELLKEESWYESEDV